MEWQPSRGDLVERCVGCPHLPPTHFAALTAMTHAATAAATFSH
jgi:hypothetical protein